MTEQLFGGGVPVSKGDYRDVPSPRDPRVNHSVSDWVRAEMGDKRRTSTKSTDLANPGRGRGSYRFRARSY